MVTDQRKALGTLELDIREKFRRSGYTLTSQRRAVLEALEEAKGHPSAEDIYLIVKKKNPRVALGTVYQALSVLEEIGVIGSKHWSESPTRYDLNVEPHLDIRCARCGAVSEIPGVELAELEEQIRNNTPYQVSSATMVIEGLCPTCKDSS
jgi:Fe2+ or Zn2+ uptake regulation protein